MPTSELGLEELKGLRKLPKAYKRNCTCNVCSRVGLAFDKACGPCLKGFFITLTGVPPIGYFCFMLYTHLGLVNTICIALAVMFCGLVTLSFIGCLARRAKGFKEEMGIALSEEKERTAGIFVDKKTKALASYSKYSTFLKE